MIGVVTDCESERHSGTILRANKGKAASQGPNVIAGVSLNNGDYCALYPRHPVAVCHSLANVSQLGLHDSRPGPDTARFFPMCTECTVILLPPLPLCVTPSPQWPQAAPPLSRGEAGQESSSGRGRGWSGVSFLSTSSLSARIQSFEVTQPSQTKYLQ